MKNKKLLLTLATIIAMFLYINININKIYSVTLKNNSNSILFNNSEELDFRNSLNINLLAQNYEKKTIDITFLALGDHVGHEHVYETKYDSSVHWEECIICDKKINIASRTFSES